MKLIIMYNFNRRKYLRCLNRLYSTLFSLAKLVPLSLCFISSSIIAQEKKLNYEVIRNGDVIGHLNVHQYVNGSALHIKATSEVKSRVIILLLLLAKEETTFSNGVIVFSSIYRTLNGKEKTNTQIKLEGNTYQLHNEGITKQLSYGPINFNMLSMYGTEPGIYKKAYSDSFREFVPVEKTGINSYKVTFPDGSYNNYFYEDGICTKVEVHHTWYSLKFLLVR